MAKKCDNTSVGVIIRKKSGEYAVIKRMNYPVAFAFVAGHLDGDTPQFADLKEAREEVGIHVHTLRKKAEQEFRNPCKREGGSHHYWYVYEAAEWGGDLKASSDAKDAFWMTPEELHALLDRTHSFEAKYGPLTNDSVGDFTKKVVEDLDWQRDPGFEPIWTLVFESLK